jgi:hypothetical protein
MGGPESLNSQDLCTIPPSGSITMAASATRVEEHAAGASLPFLNLSSACHVRFGSVADLTRVAAYVRFVP